MLYYFMYVTTRYDLILITKIMVVFVQFVVTIIFLELYKKNN